MSDQDPNQPESPLVFPCEFPIKAMGSGGEEFRQHVVEIVEARENAPRILAVETRDSRGGRFLSVTVRVRAESREQLDDLYRALNGSEQVLMTL